LNVIAPEPDAQSGIAQGHKNLTNESPAPEIIDHTVGVFVMNLDRPIRFFAHLHYDPEDPFAIHATFSSGMSADAPTSTWIFSRSLFEEGMRVPTGDGSVCVCPYGPDWTLMELCGQEGVAAVIFNTTDLILFLQHTYESVPVGQEHRRLDLDRLLASLLNAS
jgi:hypothetical protein